MPSNLILMKVGAPLWLSIIIVSWGVTATAFAGLNGTTSFYVLRLLLGCTEAGTFPGVEHLKVLPAWCMLRAEAVPWLHRGRHHFSCFKDPCLIGALWQQNASSRWMTIALNRCGLDKLSLWGVPCWCASMFLPILSPVWQHSVSAPWLPSGIWYVMSNFYSGEQLSCTVDNMLQRHTSIPKTTGDTLMQTKSSLFRIAMFQPAQPSHK